MNYLYKLSDLITDGKLENIEPHKKYSQKIV